MDDSLLTVVEILNDVSRTTKRLEKEAFLKELLEDERLSEIASKMFELALNTFKTFGIRTYAGIMEANFKDPEYDFDEFYKWITNCQKNNRTNIEEAVEFLSHYTFDIRYWLVKVLLKDLDMGVSYATVNKIWPGLVPMFSVQLANTLNKLEDLGTGVLNISCEPKLDGLRCICIIKNQQCTFLSRTGQPLHNAEKIGEFLIERCNATNTKEIVFDGELYVKSLKDTMRVARRSVNAADEKLLKNLTYYVFDSLTPEEFETNLCVRSYLERRTCIPLESMSDDMESPAVKTDNVYVVSTEEIEEYSQACLSVGLEGIMLKKIESPYIFGRSSDWLKFKPLKTDDFLVVRTYFGSGRNSARLGGLVIEYNGVETCVGGGFSDTQREEFISNPPIGKYITVEFKEITDDCCLREPVFICIREDL